MIQFQQSEQTAERRRWILVLVDSTDGVTGKTGQTGTVFISKNGGAGVASTNSIVEVDTGDMPGHYYVELTAAELDTLGWVSISYKAANTLAFHDRAIVSYNDPYQSVGGFSGGGGGTTLTREHIDVLIKGLTKAFKEEIAKIKIPKPLPFPKPVPFPKIEIPDYSTILKDIEKKETDITPILKAIANIEKPEKPKDYSGDLQKLLENVQKLVDIKVDTPMFAKSVADFRAKMDVATQEINSSLKEVNEIKDGFADLKELTYEFGLLIKDMSDMDKRFEGMTGIMQKQELNSLIGKLDDSIKKLLIAVTESKFDIIEELNNK